MKLRRKWVVFAALAVLLVVLVPVVATSWYTSRPEYKARSLLDELRPEPPGWLRQWLIDLDLIEPSRGLDTRHIEEELVQLGPRAIPVLAESLRDDDPQVRYTAAMALAEFGQPAVPWLVHALSSDYPAVRTVAAQSLAKMGPAAQKAAPVLTELLTDEYPLVRLAAAEALMRSGASNAPVRVFIDALNGKSTWPKDWAASALGRIGPAGKEAAPSLVRLLSHENKELRLTAAVALAKVDPEGGPQKAVPVLVPLLKDEDLDLQSLAISGLGGIGKRAGTAAAPLGELVHDEEVGSEAIYALGKMGEPGVSIVLRILEQDKAAWSLRYDAVGSLADAEVRSERVTQALRKALNDGNVNVRKAAAEALNKIQAAPGTRKAARHAEAKGEGG